MSEPPEEILPLDFGKKRPLHTDFGGRLTTWSEDLIITEDVKTGNKTIEVKTVKKTL